MCGIIAIASRPRAAHGGSAPDLGGLAEQLQAALDTLTTLDPRDGVAAWLDRIAGHLRGVDGALQGPVAVAALAADPVGRARLGHLDADLRDRSRAREAEIDAAMDAGEVDDPVEAVNASLVAVKDALWAIRHDRLRRRGRGRRPGRRRRAAVGARRRTTSVQLALSALDRLEVRGPRLGRAARARARPRARPRRPHGAAHGRGAHRRPAVLRSGAVRVVDGRLSFVYKAAAEIGELGDNTAALRTQIRNDELLRLAVRSDEPGALVLGHTRWASVGIISEANAHPLNSDELESAANQQSSYVAAALNGDVDNYADLVGRRAPAHQRRDHHRRQGHPGARSPAGAPTGAPLVEAFRADRRVLRGFGGHRRGARPSEPDSLLLALRGSGQALYVGLAEDMFVVASEPYGLVEESRRTTSASTARRSA